MVPPKFGMILLAALCLLQATYGLLYGLSPEHFLNKLQRVRLLQQQEQQLKRLHEAEEQQIYFNMLQSQNSPDSFKQNEFVNNALTTPHVYAVEFKASSLLSAIRGALISPSPSFKYSFIGK